MAFLDSSVIIDYLDGVERVVEYVEEQSHLHTSSLCVYEVLYGEVLNSGETDVWRARQQFNRVEAIDFNEAIAIEAARMQDQLAESGRTMPTRDLLIAASARSTGDALAVSDGDFVVEPVRELVEVRDLR